MQIEDLDATAQAYLEESIRLQEKIQALPADSRHILRTHINLFEESLSDLIAYIEACKKGDVAFDHDRYEKKKENHIAYTEPLRSAMNFFESEVIKESEYINIPRAVSDTLQDISRALGYEDVPEESFKKMRTELQKSLTQWLHYKEQLATNPSEETKKAFEKLRQELGMYHAHVRGKLKEYGIQKGEDPFSETNFELETPRFPKK